MRLIHTLSAAVILATGLSGCATVINGTKQDVTFQSDPPGSAVTINGVPVGRTPVTLSLRRHSMVLVGVVAEGYEPVKFTLNQRRSSWVWGNMVFAGPAGLVVGSFIDLFLAKGGWKFDPTPVSAVLAKKLEPSPQPLSVAGSGVKGAINVAVAEFKAEGVGASDAAVVADILRGELVKNGKFNMLDRQNMDKIMAEHAFQQTGCTDQECAVKLGRLLNVQRLVVGSFGKLIGSYVVNISVIDVETGTVTYADVIKGDNVDQIMAGVRAMGTKMTGGVIGIPPGTLFP